MLHQNQLLFPKGSSYPTSKKIYLGLDLNEKYLKDNIILRIIFEENNSEN